MRPAKNIGLIAGGCALILIVLYVLADKSPGSRLDFRRTFISPLQEQRQVVPVDENTYIAGSSGEVFYFVNRKTPLTLKSISKDDKKFEQIEINIGKEKLLHPLVTIDSPSFYVKDGSSATLLRGQLEDDSAVVRKIKGMTIPFVDLVPITRSSYVLRAINGNMENTLLKYNEANSGIVPGEEILTKQEEGIFSSAGALLYSTAVKMIVYVYYYRNTFVLSDTTMHRYAIGETADTTRIAKIKPLKLQDNKYTLASPAVPVNPMSTIYDRYLLIGSTIMGLGETEDTFIHTTVIDVYRLPETTYVSSFYVPDHENEKLRSLRVIKNSILCMYDHYAVLYSMDTDHFETLDPRTRALPAE